MMQNKIICGDALTVLKTLPAESVNCVVTSPPYFNLRDYGIKGQLGLESTFQEYINKLCDIFDEVKRVLRKDGTCWVNLGDTYGGANSRASNGGRAGYGAEREGIYSRGVDKSLCQIPSRFAIEMCNRGWILRNEIIWYKPNCMPSSASDRFTVDFEKLFFFVKNKRYRFEQQYEAHQAPMGKPRAFAKKGNNDRNDTGRIYNPQSDTSPQGRNKRCVWKIPTQPYTEAHFAVFPEKLCITPIRAGCPKGGTVLDPFCGAGTTGVVAAKLGRKFIGIELSEKYCEIARCRIRKETEQQKLF